MFDASTWRERFRFHDDAQQPTDATNIFPLSKKKTSTTREAFSKNYTYTSSANAGEGRGKTRIGKREREQSEKKCQKEKGKY